MILKYKHFVGNDLFKVFAFLFTFFFEGIATMGSSNATDGVPLDSDLKTFNYKYLSNEKIDPFLWYGEVPVFEKGKERLNEYVRAAREISDVRDCLIKKEQKKAVPDLRMIDWHRLGPSPILDVCLFRIFTSIGSIDGVVNWLKYQKIEPTISPNYKNYSYWQNGDEPKEELHLREVRGQYDSTSNGPLISQGLIYNFLSGWLLPPVYSESISTYWNDHNQLMHVNYSYSKK